MAQTVMIKSNRYGINLILDPDIAFADLLKAIIEKFKESEKFFKNSKLGISFEGRRLSDEEEQKIIDAINELATTIKDSKVETKEETTKVVLDETPEETQVQDHDIEMQNYFYELQKTPNETEKQYMARLRNDNLINHKSTSRVYMESLKK